MHQSDLLRVSPCLVSSLLLSLLTDAEFGCLSGARVVRIATHPDYFGMGYGSEALKQLQAYYQGDIIVSEESVARAAEIARYFMSTRQWETRIFCSCFCV